MDDADAPTKINSVENYTGYTNFPEEMVEGQGVYVVNDKQDLLQIVLMVETADPAPTEPETVYAISEGYTEQDADGYHYTVYVAGQGTVDYVSKTQNDGLAKGKVVTFTVKDGKLESPMAADSLKEGKVSKVEDTYVVIDNATNNAYTLLEDYDVYGGKLEVGAKVALYGTDKNVAFVVVLPAQAAAE